MHNVVSLSKKPTTPKVDNLSLSLWNNDDKIEPNPYDYGCYYMSPILKVSHP